MEIDYTLLKNSFQMEFILQLSFVPFKRILWRNEQSISSHLDKIDG